MIQDRCTLAEHRRLGLAGRPTRTARCRRGYSAAMVEPQTASLVGVDRADHPPAPWPPAGDRGPATCAGSIALRRAGDARPPAGRRQSTAPPRHGVAPGVAQVWWDVVHGHHAVRDAGSRHGTRWSTAPSIGGPARDPPRRQRAPPRRRRRRRRAAGRRGRRRIVDRDNLPGRAPARRGCARRRARRRRGSVASPDRGRHRHRQGVGRDRAAPLVAARRALAIAVNCATLTRELVESQPSRARQGRLHRRAPPTPRGCSGRPTAARSALDEIGELPLALRPKLARACRTAWSSRPCRAASAGGVDVRLVAATNREIWARRSTPAAERARAPPGAADPVRS
ncbi:MAG: sigma 54-interacting transcriptional regulator [Kofleriaceae bacterium]|nr:sigma 54-interacting transcriptional regulator [Kofleriaceae bacterium]